MSWSLTSTGSAVCKAGAKCNQTIIVSGSVLEKWSNEAEAQINTLTRRDWVGASGSTITAYKNILEDLASDLIAMKIIQYDMSGYTSRYEVTTMLDLLFDNVQRNLNALKKDEIKEVVTSS